MGKTEEVDTLLHMKKITLDQVMAVASTAKIDTMMTHIAEPLDLLQAALAEVDVLWKASTETS